MPVITKGSDKQIAWATAIVEQEVARIDRLLAPIPAKEDRKEMFQRLYGEQIAFVKIVRNTLNNRVQDAKFVIDNRDNLFFWTASLLRKSDPKFAERFPLGSKNDVTAQVCDGNALGQVEAALALASKDGE